MADTDSLDALLTQSLNDFPTYASLRAYAAELRAHARSLESQLAGSQRENERLREGKPAVDDILDYEWHEGRPHTAHRQHRFYYDCAVCQGDVARMLAVAP